jgi:hypothetical protein
MPSFAFCYAFTGALKRIDLSMERIGPHEVASNNALSRMSQRILPHSPPYHNAPTRTSNGSNVICLAIAIVGMAVTMLQ